LPQLPAPTLQNVKLDAVMPDSTNQLIDLPKLALLIGEKAIASGRVGSIFMCDMVAV
jgi:hypothetical protein